MKKILYFLSFVGVLWACDPMEDSYNKIDEAQKPFSKNVEYTLVDADYGIASATALALAQNAEDTALANAIKSQLAFNERFPGSAVMNGVLAVNYPVLNEGSVAKVTYREGKNPPAYYANFSSIYSLTQADYQFLWGSSEKYVESFTPAKNPQANMPAVLANAFANDANGTYRFVSYYYSEKEAYEEGGLSPVSTEDWETHTPSVAVSENGWINKDVTGTLEWLCKEYSGNRYVQASSYNSNENNEAWLIHQYDLTNATLPVFTFDVKIAYWNANCLSVWVSDNFDGNPANIATATWTDISSNFTFNEEPTSGYGSFYNAGEADLSAYNGKTIYIAFKYSGNGTDNSATTTYQLDNIILAESTTVLKVDSKEIQYAAYTKDNGTWKEASDMVVLQKSDYDGMGKSYLSSDDAPLYIPNFLKIKYPYAVEGDKKEVAYRRNSYGGGAIAEYVLTNGEWQLNTFVETITNQFIHNGEFWVFDPTVHFTPSSNDYQLLVDYVYDNLSRDYGSSYGNDEFYYGASAYYKNFDLRLSKRADYSIPGFDTGTEEEKIALTWQRVEEGIAIMLQLKYPQAVTEVSGIPVYYWVTFTTYENNLAKNSYTGIFKCTKAGPAPTFERDQTLEDKAVADGALTSEEVDWNRN